MSTSVKSRASRYRTKAHLPHLKGRESSRRSLLQLQEIFRCLLHLAPISSRALRLSSVSQESMMSMSSVSRYLFVFLLALGTETGALRARGWGTDSRHDGKWNGRCSRHRAADRRCDGHRGRIGHDGDDQRARPFRAEWYVWATLVVRAPGFLELRLPGAQRLAPITIELDPTPNYMERVQVTATKTPLEHRRRGGADRRRRPRDPREPRRADADTGDRACPWRRRQHGAGHLRVGDASRHAAGRSSSRTRCC